MTKVKLCGLFRDEDIGYVNIIKPDYTGFVFWDKSRRNLTKEKAREFKEKIDKDIKVAGVCVDADLIFVADLYKEKIIDYAQLHGAEDDVYINELRAVAKGIVIVKSFMTDDETIKKASVSVADYIIFDPGKGDGMTFEWERLKGFKRDYFLAGGLNSDNVRKAIDTLDPYAVDVSSGIETDGIKDFEKMKAFTECVRKG